MADWSRCRNSKTAGPAQGMHQQITRWLQRRRAQEGINTRAHEETNRQTIELSNTALLKALFNKVCRSLYIKCQMYSMLNMRCYTMPTQYSVPNTNVFVFSILPLSLGCSF